MAQAFTQFRTVQMGPDMSPQESQDQLNDILKEMQVVDKFQIIDVVRKDNSYDILYHVTMESDPRLQVDDINVVVDRGNEVASEVVLDE